MYNRLLKAEQVIKRDEEDPVTQGPDGFISHGGRVGEPQYS